MMYKVGEKTIRRTMQCQHDFKCLNDKGWTSCGVTNDLEGAFLHLKDNCHNPHCPYLMSFGQSSYFCHCPVRCEIYKKYEI